MPARSRLFAAPLGPFALFSAAACRAPRESGATPPAAGGAGHSPPAPSATADTAPAAVANGGAGGRWSVTLERSGGFIGRTELMVIAPDGSVMVGPETRRHPGGASAAADLATRLDVTGVYRVPPGRYLPARPGPDHFNYLLTLVRGGARFEYATAEDAPNVPRGLSDAIRLVEQYVAAAR